MHKPWRYLPLLAAGLLVLAAIQPGCSSTGTYESVKVEIGLAAKDAESLSAMAEALEEPGLAEAAANVSIQLQAAADALEAYQTGVGSAGDVWAKLEGAMSILQGIALEHDDGKTAILIEAAKMAVRRAQAYFPVQ